MVSKINGWLVENTRQIGTVENAVRTLTMFAPGQVQQLEVISEASAAAIAGLSVWHDIAVAQFLKEKRPDLVNSHSKYVEFLNGSALYTAATSGYSLCRATELLVEMVARQRGGEEGRWKAVLGLEGAKAALRLAALAASNRPLAHSLVYERALTPEQIELLLGEKKELPSEGWKMPRSKKTLPCNTPTAATLTQKVLAAEDVLDPGRLIKPLNPLTRSAEILAILRPLLYALAAYRFRRKASWRPWIFGLLVELFSRQLTLKAMALQGRHQTTLLEKEYVRQRASSLKWWALRGEFYSRYTRPLIAGAASKLDGVPVLSFVGMLVEDSLYLWDTYYFSSASV